ncbi:MULTISPECIES: ExeM/NucH family extracellular endonuclease [Stenotrophomonas]|uniref:ExeM/NucH family extracellular endonuclease n=1 Tax=Stenotrophomonas TaxID=40323 RepID=UPI001CF192F6|nr:MULTISPECIES: ExeM/NucH family extracellular endonuclease [Stenotrophomonas]MCA7023587.1 ExeM/NucH family extracellular endonuclease [Stenotrophomonas acidaminiphila]MCE4075332.1 ExeM/NucH family extracellular endonuclease [Stenotrophomonas acidaminiphila]
MRHLPALLALSLSVALAPQAVARTPAVLAIGQVQGSGPRSPLEGRLVTIEGFVSADLRAGLGGVFLQDAGDRDPATSDALFVQLDPARALPAGQWLRVTGTVQELAAGKGGQTLTALQAETVAAARARPAPGITVLEAVPASWEALEGMKVRIAAPLTLAGQDQLARHGELTVAFDGRLWQPTELAAAGTAENAALGADNARRRLRLDDGSSQRDPGRVSYLPEAAQLRTGMVFRGVEGVVDQRYDGDYRLQLTAALPVPAIERPQPPAVAGALRIAAFNLENYFNGDGHGGGFPTLRGAKTFAQFQAQQAKLVATIRGLDADVAALMELENDGYGPDSAIAGLVRALNEGQDKERHWAFVDAGKGPGDNPIRVGIIYRAARVAPVGRPAVLEREPFGERSRVPLAQAFRMGRTGRPFVVVANHFKSKGCSEASGADADQNDGQGCWTATRVASARLLHQWLQRDPTGSGGGDAVLLGDFNAYAMEDPIRQLQADGWRDAFKVAGVSRPYSYVYNGLTGRLDHALLNPGMAARLKGAAEWHINADEADDAGYQGRNVPGPWRSSDHDPLLLGFDP